MPERYHDLTEKEKQALRLLVIGHDAKSMAKRLGLSVHTINERLRDARRKMGTSSSREAARLLREAELVPPENLGYETLGDNVPGKSEQPAIRSDDRRRTKWIIGGIAMLFALALASLTQLSGPPAAAPSEPAISTAETSAVASARQWLALVDAGDWDASWQATGQAFKAQNTPAAWADASTQVHRPLGALKSRKLLAVDFTPAPPYGYWVVKFQASYANKDKAIETVSLAREGDDWKVVGIMID